MQDQVNYQTINEQSTNLSHNNKPQKEHLIYNSIMKTLYDSNLLAKLTKQDLLKVDFQFYTPLRQHFASCIIASVQIAIRGFHLGKLDQEQSQKWTDKADQAVGKTCPRVRGAPKASRLVRRIPVRRVPRGRRGRFGRGFYLAQKVLPMPITTKIGRGRSMCILQNSRSFQPSTTQLQLQQKQEQPQKNVRRSSKPFPELIKQKCERNAAIKLFQQARKYIPPVIQAQLYATPQYFRKKKVKQKRRRQIKYELIKKNRRALMQIYIAVIFQSCWHVGIKQSRLFSVSDRRINCRNHFRLSKVFRVFLDDTCNKN